MQNVGYHVRELAKLGLIELVRTTQRRGALEHHYTAVPCICELAWSDLPPIVPMRTCRARNSCSTSKAARR